MADKKKTLVKSFFSYTLLPGLMPRFSRLTSNGFRALSHLIALVYNGVGLLPTHHPYVTGAMRGQFGVRHVIIEAHKNVKYSRSHIDQVVVFYAILSGLILLSLQFLILLGMSISGSASAQSLPTDGGFLANLFVLPAAAENTDIAYRLMKMVFGPGDVFGAVQYDGITAAFHNALHDMYIMYSNAMLIVAAIILIYFVTAVIAETAQTGTPFGKRFNHVWAPLRVVVGIGLLIPLASGFNSGQYIGLYAAKFGSNFASNGWRIFNDRMAATYLGNPQTLMAEPNAPEMMHLPSFFMLVHACDYAEERLHEKDVQGFVVTTSSDGGNTSIPLSSTYEQALNFSNRGDVYVRFGYQDPTNTDTKGQIDPACGEIHLTTYQSEPDTPGYIMQESYYNLIKAWWFADASALSINTACGGTPETPFGLGRLERMFFVGLLDLYGASYIRYFAPVPDRFDNPPFRTTTMEAGQRVLADLANVLAGGPADVGLPASDFKWYSYANMLSNVQTCIEEATRLGRETARWDVSPRIYQLGWAGAAIEYNKIAGGNGAFAAAVQAVPRPSLYPKVMEQTFIRKLAEDDNIQAATRFAPTSEQGRPIEYERDGDEDVARALFLIQTYWEGNGYRIDETATHTKATANRFLDAINAILGTQGVFDMCKNTDVHPLAQLSMVGRTLIESSIRNLGFSVASGAAGGLAYIFSPHAGAFGDAGSGFFQAVAGIGLMMGFILFYIIPFMPFIYFIFGVGGWIMGIFEAMLGIPLWALAHIRIDGQGLPGSAGKDGYFYVFEIFVRPILMVISLVASVLVFSALVKILNDMFFIVISNLAGFNPDNATACGITNGTGLNRLNALDYFRGPIDEFFFTIVYVCIVYMIGMSCFKLIDTIPDSIMRWMGENLDTFNDKTGDPAENMVSKISISGAQIGRKVQNAADSMQQAGGSLGKMGHDAMQEQNLRSNYE